MMFVLIFFLIVLVWVAGFVYSNDFSVTTKSRLKDIEKILVIFPHADDEVLTSGGLLKKFSKQGKEVNWVVLTKGERGNEGARYDEKLKVVRVKEAETVSEVYGVNSLIQREYPDNGVDEKRDELENDIDNIISEIKPDLIITYDLAGLYGHPDHIIVSEIITKLVKNKYPDVNLWYSSYPKRILDTMTLPEHMAKDNNFKENRVYPTHKVWVGLNGVMIKIKAVYNYKSQLQTYKKGFPVKQIPVWFYISMMPYEYYHEVR